MPPIKGQVLLSKLLSPVANFGHLPGSLSKATYNPERPVRERFSFLYQVASLSPERAERTRLPDRLPCGTNGRLRRGPAAPLRRSNTHCRDCIRLLRNPGPRLCGTSGEPRHNPAALLGRENTLRRDCSELLGHLARHVRGIDWRPPPA